jgi:hypothetical protein
MLGSDKIRKLGRRFFGEKKYKHFSDIINTLDKFLQNLTNDTERLLMIHKKALILTEGFRSEGVKSKVDNYLGSLVGSSRFSE